MTLIELIVTDSFGLLVFNFGNLSRPAVDSGDFGNSGNLFGFAFIGVYSRLMVLICG